MGPPPGSRRRLDADEPETSRSEQGDQASTPPSAPPPLRQQLIGACRADERLRPLLTLNVSCSAADDRFISQLSQHFEVSEVGLLARCLCVPLVSLRVGKVQRHGSFLCPTTSRGKLNLGLLPSSSMRLTFSGDDGFSEQLALMNNDSEFSEAAIEEIPADISGRSFQIRLSQSKAHYYWCAEKSKEHGMELLMKMKSLLEGRPTLSNLTGISTSRLEAFASHLHNYLLTSSIGDVKFLGSLNELVSTSRAHDLYLQPQSVVSKTSRFHASPINATKARSIHQTRLSPKSSTFKDGVTRISCTMVIGREKLKRRGELSGMSTVPIDANPLVTDAVNLEAAAERSDAECARNIVSSLPLDLPLPFPSLPSIYPLTTCPLPEVYSEKQFKPYYCWCPPGPSLQYSVTPLHLPATSVEPLPLPPLSALLSNELPSSSAVSAKLDTTDLPSLNLPSILHDPLLNLPLPTTPLVPMRGSQVPTFTPLMSDPIVHIPVIDVCSAGQAYLVSCGPSMSTVPLLPSLKPLLPEAESLVERSARETLMRLIASTPSANTTQLANILPVVVSDFPESPPRVHNVNKNIVSRDCCVDTFGCGIGAMELHSDEVPREYESDATFGEYDDTSNDCDMQRFQEL